MGGNLTEKEYNALCQSHSLIQFKQMMEEGYVTHICRVCGDETLPIEIDGEQAFCCSCDKYVDVEPFC